MPLKIDLNKVITADAETYYSTDYSLTRKELNMSGYIRHPSFKEHCWGIKIGKKAAKVYSAAEGIKVLKNIDWSTHYLLAHNTAFDGFILAHHHKIIPHFYLDTLSMTRGLHFEVSRAKLETIAQLYKVGEKSKTYLSPTKGLRDLPPEIMKDLMEGCKIDVDLTFEIFRKQVEVFPWNELRLIDTTIRMFCDSKLEVDVLRAQAALREEMLARESEIIKSKATETDLLSNVKFAALLREHDVEPPTKISPVTGYKNYALAQTDPKFLELLEHENKKVVLLARGRLAAKSTQIETRANRLIQAGESGQKLPAGYTYYAAKTGRWGGTNKLNLQNLPRGSELRRSIIAPAGHVLVVTDSAQIEARMLAWLAGQEEMLALFRAKKDVYKHAAMGIYGKPEAAITKEERFVGKVCLAEGTLIYSNRGWIEIQTLRMDDKLWDGENWVCHQGLSMNGFKETLNLCGLWLTPDHLVWSGTKWLESQYLERDARSLSQALAFAAANSPLLATSDEFATALARSSSSAVAASQNIQSISRTSRPSEARAALSARGKRLLQNGIGVTQKLWQMIDTGSDYLIVCPQRSLAATPKRTVNTTTTAGAAYSCFKNGATTVPLFSNTCSSVLGGMTRVSKWIGATITRATSRAIYGLSPDPTTPKTSETSASLRRKSNVYDVLSVGPKNRFLALTNRGPLLVHNCTLGLGYGMGAVKFQTTLALGMMGPPMQIKESEAKRIVNLYRRTNYCVPIAWKIADGILHAMLRNESGVEFKGTVEYERGRIWLPNGMPINYPGLHIDEHQNIRYKSFDVYKKLYGGLVIENIVQAIARIAVGEQALDIEDELKKHKLKKGEVTAVSMLTHDEVVTTVPERLAEKQLATQTTCMRKAPAWCADMPFDADGGFDRCYSK